jgi:hypothetical protein
MSIFCINIHRWITPERFVNKLLCGCLRTVYYLMGWDAIHSNTSLLMFSKEHDASILWLNRKSCKRQTASSSRRGSRENQQEQGEASVCTYFDLEWQPSVARSTFEPLLGLLCTLDSVEALSCNARVKTILSVSCMSPGNCLKA